MDLSDATSAVRLGKQWARRSTPFKPLGENQIRLLSILPGRNDEPLHCSLIHYTLAAAKGTHTAISYPWGPPEDPHHSVWVDGFEFIVRDNAFNILMRLRRSDESVKAWIDCLCINQKNKPEKSAQIRLMYSIYKQAAKTIIWLGKFEGTSHAVYEFIQSLDVDQIYLEFRDGWGSRWRYPTKSFILDMLKDHSDKAYLINGIAKLFFAVYWSRVWIRQEAAVGGGVVLFWGEYELTWRQVAILAWLYRPRTGSDWEQEDWPDFDYAAMEYTTETILIMNAQREYDTDWRLRAGNKNVMSTPLFAHLVYARSALTTNPHDKVYALSSMASDMNVWYGNVDAFLKPDYNLSWQEIYVLAAKHFFSLTAIAYQVLDHAGMVFQGASSDLPSWVPDWRYPNLPMFIPSEEWSAGGNSENVRTRIMPLNKKQRAQLLSYKGYASILTLCGQLPRDKCKVTQSDQYLNLDMRNHLSAEYVCNDPNCKDKMSKEDYGYLESASRAALALEIQVCMRDEIIYLSHMSNWEKEVDMPNFRHEIFSVDAETLSFLDKQAPNHTGQLYITSEPLREAYNWTLIASQDSESAPATSGLVSTADDWRAWLANDGIDHMSTRPDFHRAIESSFTFRNFRFAYTRSGYMCLVPQFTKLGDNIVIVSGYSSPFVVRPTVADYCVLIGQCYVHGVMHGNVGELMDEFLIKFDEKSGKTVIKRPDGDVRANGLKMDAGRYVDILETLGTRWIKLI